MILLQSIVVSAFATVVATGFLSLPAFAQPTDEQRDQCKLYDDRGNVRKGVTPDLAVDACTVLIQTGRESGRNLAVLFTNRGAAYNDKGRRDLAGQDYDRAIKSYPNYAEAWNQRCALEIELDRVSAALLDCNRALKLNPNLITAHDNRGDVRLELGQLDGAIGDYSRELQINPDMDSALYGRGVAKTLKGDSAGGAADIAAAQTINPRVAKDQPHLARLLPAGQ